MELLETLGQFEGLILTAIKHLKEDAYGMQIYGEVCRMADRDVNLGSMYVTLERLKKKGYVKYRVERGGPARRGKPRKFYTLLPLGAEVLLNSVETAKRMAATYSISENEDNHGLEPDHSRVVGFSGGTLSPEESS
jgi:DNA-binding PadR family transcriptional regulator